MNNFFKSSIAFFVLLIIDFYAASKGNDLRFDFILGVLFGYMVMSIPMEIDKK